ncbi:hypothetical protein NPA31_007070 [Aurantimonas sp. MSK8Z-1]|uniref:hypothetical protein n=1 Tax=Mangrovibrevibacter kandeliae TaxID=2968473 RepID=UPI002118BCCA|nr:hypothetical protein [Aurantimonas sp. MSK8Z-1]MCW4114722.1 hypothetical protein [Aurantimonas sp. MSK8Z-1]
MSAHRPTGLRRHLTFANLVSSAVCLLAFPWLYWAIVDRQPAADSVSEVLSSEVRQGDFLQIHYRLTWRSRCEIVAFRYIIDEMRVEWPITAESRIVQPGSSDFLIRVPVPLAAAPGAAVYRATLRYECNPFQRFFPLEQDLKPRSFRILAGPNPSTGVEQGRLDRGVPLVRRFAEAEE